MAANAVQLWRMRPIAIAPPLAPQVPPDPPDVTGRASVAYARPLSLTRLWAQLSDSAAYSFDPGGYFDALNADNWLLTRVGGGYAPLVVRVSADLVTENDYYFIDLVSPMDAGAAYDLATQNIAVFG